MEHIEIGKMIYNARKEKGYTQKQVAELLSVSDKAVSKWETGGGCPDIRILADLAEVLRIDEKALLSGIAMTKDRDSGNLKKTRFYICPACGNVITSTSQADMTCCGRKLMPLECHEKDEAHLANVELTDGDYYVSIPKHPMTKEHYIMFICYVTGDKMRLTRLYPEQSAEARFTKTGHGIIYIACNNHGLFRKIV